MQALGSIPITAGQLITLNTRTYSPNQIHGLALMNGSGYWLTVSALGNMQTIPPGVNDLIELSPTVDLQFTIVAGMDNHNPGVLTSEIQGNLYEVQDPLPRGYPYPNPAYVVGNTPTARIGGQGSWTSGSGPGTIVLNVPVGPTDRMLAILVASFPTNIQFYYYATTIGNVTGMDYTKLLSYDANFAGSQNSSNFPIMVPVVGGVDTSIQVTISWSAFTGTSLNTWCWVGPDNIFLGTNSLPLQTTDTPWVAKGYTNIGTTSSTPVVIVPAPSGNIAGYQVLKTYVAQIAATTATAGTLQIQGTSNGLNSYGNVQTWQAFSTSGSHYIFDNPAQPWVIQDGLSFYNLLTPTGMDCRAGAWVIPIDNFYLRNKE